MKTPSAVASVQGTLFWGLTDEELNTTYACLENQIEIRGRSKKIILKPGEKVSIPYGHAPQKKEPANIAADFIDSFEVEGSVEGLKDMVNQ